MFSSFSRFCSASVKKTAPLLACTTAGFAVSCWLAAPAVAQTSTPSPTQEARYAAAAARVSPVYNADALTRNSDIFVITANSEGNWQKDPYGITVECWTSRNTTHSSFSGAVTAYIKNETNATVTLGPPDPYVNMFATGSISVATQLDTHHVKSKIHLDATSAQGEANYPHGDVDYVNGSVRYPGTYYQPGDEDRMIGSCEGDALSTFFLVGD